MQQLTVNIPDNKVAFFIHVAKHPGFAIEPGTPKVVLSANQIELVNEARKAIKDNPEL